MLMPVVNVSSRSVSPNEEYKEEAETEDAIPCEEPASYTFSRHAIRSTYMDKSIEAKKKVIRMLFVVVAEFFVCWAPLHVLNTWYLFSPEVIYQYVGSTGVSLVQLLAYISSCCNPITYCFMNKKFRQAFLNVFHRYRSVSLLASQVWTPHHLHVPFSRMFYPNNRRSEVVRKMKIFTYFCDWYPKLFGIDEDEIPASEDEEGCFDIDYDDIEARAEALTDAELDALRMGPYSCLTDDELREVWMRNQHPKYGRRARQKPILHRENDVQFECICDIDMHFCRHYVPRFGGGVEKEGEEFKIPHFKAFWEDFKEKCEMGGLERLSNIFDSRDRKDDMGPLKLTTLKFPAPEKNSIKKFKKQLLSSFRPLHCREVRRYRIPYSEALYLELQEDECHDGATFFKNLIIKDYFRHRSPEFVPEFSLRDHRYIMNKIVEILRLADRFSRREEYHKEAYVYLRSGKYFNDHEKNWWWLAEEFYKKSVKVSQNCVIDGGKAEAICNYIFGTFLLDCVHRVQPAQEHLLKARELSQGKDWSARNILKRYQDTVHKECANYLCRALIATSKELRKRGKPEEALPLIHRSYKLCEELDSSRSDIEMETYFELGMTYQAVGMIDWAKTAFRRFLERADMQGYVKGVCDGYLELAICCRSEGDLERCHRHLFSFYKAAKADENENLIAFAERYLGEFHLNNGNPQLASEFFKKAFDSFHQQLIECAEVPFAEWQSEHFTLPSDVELTRVLLGLAKGEMLTKPICSLILQTEEGNENLLKLIEWKNDPQKFSLQDLTSSEQEEIEIPLQEDDDDNSSDLTEGESRTVRFVSEGGRTHCDDTCDAVSTFKR